MNKKMFLKPFDYPPYAKEQLKKNFMKFFTEPDRIDIDSFKACHCDFEGIMILSGNAKPKGRCEKCGLSIY